MCKEQKTIYESPWAELVALAQEGSLCASEVKGRSVINDWGTGDSTTEEVYL